MRPQERELFSPPWGLWPLHEISSSGSQALRELAHTAWTLGLGLILDACSKGDTGAFAVLVGGAPPGGACVAERWRESAFLGSGVGGSAEPSAVQ